MTKHRTKQRFTASLVGLGVMLLLSVAVVLLIPIFILNEYLPAEYTSAFIIISMGLIAFAGTITACGLTENRKWEAGALAVGVYYLLPIFMAIFLYDGLNMGLLYRIAAGVLGYGAALLMGKLQKKPRAKRKKRRGNR